VYEAIIQRCVLEKDARYAVAVQELEEFGYTVSPALRRIISGEGEREVGDKKTERRREGS